MNIISKNFPKKTRPSRRRYRLMLVVPAILCVAAFFIRARSMSTLRASLANRETTNSPPSPHSLTSSKGAIMQARLTSHGLPTVSCATVMQKFREDLKKDPNEGHLYSRYVPRKHPFYISLHNEKYDPTRYAIIKFGDYYEIELSNNFEDILKGGNGRVLDVGGNVGWFALLAAASGAEVATFEPNEVNYLRMCESMCLNGWLHPTNTDNSASPPESHCLQGSLDNFIPERVYMFPYAVGEKDETLHFSTHVNPGQGSVATTVGANTLAVRGITLDGMAAKLGWIDQEIDILKVDIEGHELPAFLGGQGLLKAKQIKNVFMEGNIRIKEEMEKFDGISRLLLQFDYFPYKIGGFRGPSIDIELDTSAPNFFEELKKKCGIDEVTDKPQLQCNLWWKPK
eukprot:scaffold172954_cov60-Attheya_sp.AAC.2